MADKWECVASEFGEDENEGLVAFWVRMEKPTLCFAHADLISAAPTLYLALNDVHDFLRSHGYDTTLVKSALAKARGEANG